MRINIILMIMLLLTGCSSTAINAVSVEKRINTIPVFHPPMPDGLSLTDIKWKVLTPAIMEEYLKDLKEGKAPVLVFYGITPKGYEALAGNVSEFKRYIKGQKAIILYYRNYKKNAKKAIEADNKKIVEKSKEKTEDNK